MLNFDLRLEKNIGRGLGTHRSNFHRSGWLSKNLRELFNIITSRRRPTLWYRNTWPHCLLIFPLLGLDLLDILVIIVNRI